jgi:hypothetical protein
MAADSVIIASHPSVFEPSQNLSVQSVTVLEKNEDRNFRYFIHGSVVFLRLNLKGIVRREIREVYIGITRTVSTLHTIADVFQVSLKGLDSLNCKKPVSAFRKKKRASYPKVSIQALPRGIVLVTPRTLTVRLVTTVEPPLFWP